MSRDGFTIADTDTGMMADPKVLALARHLRDSTRTGAAITLYDAVRLASWKAGRRLTLEETAPGWWIDPTDDLAASLVNVGLLDDEHRIPAHAWEGWFAPALDRHLANRRRSVYGGLVSRGMLPADANAEADRRMAEERARYGLPQPNRLNLIGSTYRTEPYRTVPVSKLASSNDAPKKNGADGKPEVIADLLGTYDERLLEEQRKRGLPVDAEPAP